MFGTPQKCNGLFHKIHGVFGHSVYLSSRSPVKILVKPGDECYVFIGYRHAFSVVDYNVQQIFVKNISYVFLKRFAAD